MSDEVDERAVQSGNAVRTPEPVARNYRLCVVDVCCITDSGMTHRSIRLATPEDISLLSGLAFSEGL